MIDVREVKRTRPAGGAELDGHVHVGDVLEPFELTTLNGEAIRVPDAQRLVHLQFRRYAGCPVCNLHLHTIAQRHGEILAAGIREVVAFHSRVETMRDLQGYLPFVAIADPEKKLYARFGVEKMSPLLALNPRSWRAAANALLNAPSLRGATGKGEEHTGLPAEFLIRPDGQVVAVKYGKITDDHWSVDQLLDLKRGLSMPTTAPATMRPTV